MLAGVGVRMMTGLPVIFLCKKKKKKNKSLLLFAQMGVFGQRKG